LKTSSINLANIKLILTVLLAVALPFSGSLKIISLFILLMIVLVQIYKKEITVEWSALHFGFLALLLAALFSSVFADIPSKSLKGTRDILYFTISFFVAQSITDKKHIKTILWTIFISTSLAAIIEIVQSVQMSKILEIHSLGNGNYTAMYLVIVATAMISYIIFSEKKELLSKIVISALLSIVLTAAVMTSFRSSFLGLFVFLFILLLNQRHVKFVKYLSVVIVGASIIFSYMYKPMWNKFSTLLSLEYRLYLWDHAISLFKDNPFTGVGVNRYKYTYPDNIHSGTTLYDAHNVYLQTASQIGLPGIIALCFIIVGFISGFMLLNRMSDFEKSLGYGALGGFLVTFVGGILDTTLHHEHGIIFTLLAGFMYAIINLHSRTIKVTDQSK